MSSLNAFVRQLIACGHQVLIIAPDFLGDAHHDEPYVKRVASFTHFMYKKNPMSVPWCPDATVLRYLREFQPNVVHVQHPFLLGQSGLIAARALSVPVVFTYHTLYEHYTHYVPFYQPWVKAVVKKRVFQFCKLVDHIIAPSSAVYESLVSSNITTPITVIPSPLQHEFFSSICPAKESVLSPVRLLVVSRLVKEKNIEGALEAVAHIKDHAWHLTIVGYGDHESVLREYVQHLQLPHDRVTFIIRPSKSDLARVYRSSDIFLFPSLTDTQGLVLAEAMASGAPVVAFDGPGQRDIVREGENGYIVQSPAAMADAVARIMADPVLYIRLHQGACATAQRYNPEVLTLTLVDLYQSLIDKKSH